MASRLPVFCAVVALLLAIGGQAGPSPSPSKGAAPSPVNKVESSQSGGKPGSHSAVKTPSPTPKTPTPTPKTPSPASKPPTKPVKRPSAPKTVPIDAWEGTFEGVCTLKIVGYQVNGTAATKCLDEGVAALPYIVTYTKDVKTGKISTKYTEDAVTITKGNQTYFLPSSNSVSTSVSYTSINNSTAGPYCLQVAFKDGSKAGYTAFVDKDGSQIRYVEEGVYDSTTAQPTLQCPTKNNARLYCNKKFVSYRCVAYKVPVVKSG